jgi:hypothetical protein
MRQHTPHMQDQTLLELEARYDQLVDDLCALHLDELGASQMGDDAGAQEAAAQMRAVERELTEVGQAIKQREAVIARVRADFGPFSLPHPPIPAPQNAPASWLRQRRQEQQEQMETPEEERKA